jgi:multidrug resistance efflux pump
MTVGEHRTTRGEPPPATVSERRSWFWRTVAGVVLFLALLAAAGALLKLDRYAPATGYVTTEEYAEVRAPVAGPVARIAVTSGARVRQGDLLVQLEDAAERAAVAEADAAARASAAQLALREAELAERRRQQACQIESARLALEYARQRDALTRRLADKGLASGRELGDDAYRLQVAESEYRRLREADTTLDERQVEVLRQELATRREAVGRARAALDARAVRSPADGRILRHTFYAGEVVRSDALLYEVFGGTNLIFKLRVPERYATRVAAGQPLRAELRSYRSLLRQWVPGRVQVVRDVIETDGPQAYRVVYASLETGGRDVPPGATADAQIRIGRSSFWASLLGL